MSGYTKLSSKIINSSVWAAPDNVRIVWITMLAMSDKNGFVESSVSGIAHNARYTQSVTAQAIDVLMAPDPDSQNPAFEGRRIARIPTGGFRILNYVDHRDRVSSDPDAVANRNRQKRHREAEASRYAALRNAVSRDVTADNDMECDTGDGDASMGDGDGDELPV